MIDLAELEAKARAATQGEWDVFENLGQDEAWCDWHRVGPFDMTGGKASADDLFIQASRPSIVLELIERVRAAEANAALMAERASLIETKRDQIERLTAERDAALAKLTQFEQAPVVGWTSPNQVQELKDGYDGFMVPISMDQFAIPLIARPEVTK